MKYLSKSITMTRGKGWYFCITVIKFKVFCNFKVWELLEVSILEPFAIEMKG